MIEYPKVLYRPPATHGSDTADAALDSMIINSLEDEQKATRAGWLDWHLATKKSRALRRRREIIAPVRRFFEQWRWAFETFVVVAGFVAAIVTFFAGK